ncbi:2-hydroxyacid dehydrogenase [Yoonia sp. R2331]|uniref:2-hydroxyacid dehydrogenase n=1 Tax=Yoonia sp. R2331 TaxID=3237238 RepID=UPI0034E550CD
MSLSTNHASKQALVIPFLTRAGAVERDLWIAALTPLMQPHVVKPLADLTPQERRVARVAIVANPDPAEVAELTNLEWIQSLWAGVERLVVSLPTEVGIARLVDPDLARTMAEAVLAWTLYLHRDMPAYRRQQTKGLWNQRDYRPARDIGVGVLGLGALGREATAILSRHGYRTMGWARSARDIPGVETFHGDVGLNAMLAQTDIAVVLLPLTDQTRGLLNKTRLGRMRPQAEVINFGRGSVIPVDDLIETLDEGHISHAVLDVFEREPLPSDDPLWTRSDITILPHISAPTGRGSAAAIAATAIHDFYRTGSTPDLIDRARGY